MEAYSSEVNEISNEIKEQLLEVIKDELKRYQDSRFLVDGTTLRFNADDVAEVILNRVLDPIIDDVRRRSVFDHTSPGGEVEVSARMTQLGVNRVQIAAVAQGPPSCRRSMQLDLTRAIDNALKDFTEEYLKGESDGGSG